MDNWLGRTPNSTAASLSRGSSAVQQQPAPQASRVTHPHPVQHIVAINMEPAGIDPSCFSACDSGPTDAEVEAQRTAMTQQIRTRIGTYAQQNITSENGRQLFRELAEQALLRSGERVDKKYFATFQEKPQLVEAMLKHLDRVQKYLAPTGMDVEGLRATLEVMKSQDGWFDAVQGGVDALGFGFQGGALSPLAGKVAPALTGADVDHKLAAVLVGAGAVMLAVANRLSGMLAGGLGRFQKKHSEPRNVRAELQPLADANSNAWNAAFSLAAAVTTAYSAKNVVVRLPVNMGANHSHLSPERRDFVKDFAGDAVPSVLAGAAIPGLARHLQHGKDFWQQAALLNSDIGQDIATTYQRFIDSSSFEVAANYGKDAWRAAATMTAGMVRTAVKELLPFGWVGNVVPYVSAAVQGKDRPSLGLSQPGNWVPPFLLKMISFSMLAETIGIGGYVAGIAYMSNAVDAYGDKHNWSAEQKAQTKEALKPFIASTAYTLIILASSISKIGDKATGKWLGGVWNNIKQSMCGGEAKPPLPASDTSDDSQLQSIFTVSAHASGPEAGKQTG